MEVNIVLEHYAYVWSIPTTLPLRNNFKEK